jgi:putative flippase GtrA
VPWVLPDTAYSLEGVTELTPPTAAANPAVSRVRSLWGSTLRPAVSFGVVGLGGMVIDVGIFTALRLGVFGHGAFIEKPLTAGVISASFAIVFNWVGNRWWTFRKQRRTDVGREMVEYGAVALLGLGVGLVCLAISHYVLGLHSLAADNIAKNVVGLGLGTVVRFTLSRWWVWGASRKHAVVGGGTRPVPIPALGTDR